jgi:hypothetical protein
VVVVAVCLGTALLFDLRIPEGSTSTAEVSVAPAGLRAPLVGVRSLQPPTPAELNGRAGALLREPEVGRRVAERLRRDRYIAIPPTIAPSEVPGWFRVQVLAPDGRYASRVANAWATVLADEITKQDQRQIDEVIRSFRAQRREVRSREAADPLAGRYLLELQIERLRILRTVGKTAEVVRPAREEEADRVELSDRAPGAVLFGLSLGLVLAFLADAYSRRPRVPARLAHEAGMALAATLPKRANEGDYDRVRASLTQLLDGARSETVVVTSAGRDDGCADLAAGLVRAFARAGDLNTVIEAPGVVASADALEEAHDAAVVLVSAHAGRTSIDELLLAADALSPVPDVPVRIVVTGVPRGTDVGGYAGEAGKARVTA